MFYELYRKGKKVSVGDDQILTFSYEIEIDNVSTLSILLPLHELPHLLYKTEIKLYSKDGWSFHGHLTSSNSKVQGGTIECQFAGVLSEWERQAVPINVVKKSATVAPVLHSTDIKYTQNDWTINVEDTPYLIDYEFSRENKLEALQKVIDLTPDLHYRVSRNLERTLEVGRFGKHRDFLITEENMLDDVVVDNDSSNIINLAVALSDKGDGGSTSVTLRDIFFRPDLQDPQFPVIITGNKINTQATATGYNFPEYAPNNIHEYAVVDVEGIRREDGDIYEGTFTDNSIQPTQEDGQTITNKDRTNAAIMLYQKTKRKLINSRRNITYEKTLEYLPPFINVGDKVRVIFRHALTEFSECFGLKQTNNFEIDDWLYVTKITISTGISGLEYRVSLSKELTEYYQGREY